MPGEDIVSVVERVFGEPLGPDLIAAAAKMRRRDGRPLARALSEWATSFVFPAKAADELRPVIPRAESRLGNYDMYYGSPAHRGGGRRPPRVLRRVRSPGGERVETDSWVGASADWKQRDRKGLAPPSQLSQGAVTVILA